MLLVLLVCQDGAPLSPGPEEAATLEIPLLELRTDTACTVSGTEEG